MSQGDSQKINTACPNCGKQYLVPVSFAGRQVKCQACAHVFQIAAPVPTQPVAPQPRPAAPVQPTAPVPQPPITPPVQQSPAPATPGMQPPAPAPMAAPSAGGSAPTGNCAICQSPVMANEPSTNCPACSGHFHADCWEYNKGCGIYGCDEAPPTEGLDSLEIPASHWGQENKACPQCSQVILAAAVRCKHCGATFASANPTDRAAFQERESDKAKLPAIKVMAVVLLICSLLPCTAPLAAIAGPVLYAVNRKSIAMLPAFHSALFKIAIGVSIAITVLLIGFTILNLVS